MKHFLRKLHLGGGGGGSSRDDQLDGGRSSDAASSSASFWGLSDWFSSLRHSHNHNQIAEHSASARGRLEGEGSSVAGRSDYDSLEEEYQVQLALALSVSNDQPIDPESMEIEAVKRISLGLSPAPAPSSQAEMAAYRYWAYNVLNYDDRVLNGFYDVYGVVSDPKHPKKLPSLVDFQGEPVSSTLSYEVVLVNRETDAELVKLEKRARLARAECRGNSGGPLKSGLAQKIAIMVSEQMGGPVEDDDGMLSVWRITSWELKSSFQSNVLPLGYLHIGLARHRALLFKVLADCVGIPCRLVKGRHYTGADEGAVNIIRDIDNREYIIDLMGAPGSVIPLDADDKKAVHLGERHHSEPAGIEGALERRPGPSHGRSPSWTEGIGIRQTKAKDMSQYVIDAAKENPVLAQKLHDVLVESGVAAPPEFLAELSSKELQKKDTFFGGQEARKAGRIVKERGKPPLKPAKVDDKERLQRLKSVEGLGDRRPLESPVATSMLSAVHENFPAELIKNSPVAASAITAAVVASSMVVAAAKSDSSEEVPITAAATATAAVVAATSAAVVLKSESSSGHSDRGGGGSGDNKNKEKGSGTEDNKKSSSGQRNKKDDAGAEDERSSVLEDVAEWEIPWEELVVGERIGLGSYGEVYRGEWRGTEVAIKKFLDQDISGDALEEFITEVRLMRRMRHPNVVLFMGAVTRPPNLSIVTEFLPRGSLFKLLHRPGSQLDERRRMRMALDVAKGMNYLHTSTPVIVHRDLKSPNLLVDKNWVVKVCDFGLSRMKHHTFLSSKSQAGTPEWMAPEVLRNEPSDEKADVYSFGVILWELATMQQPWHGMNSMQVVGAVGFQNRRLDIPTDMDPAIAKIIQDCWHNDPKLRPSFAEIMRSLRPFQRPVIASQSDSGKQKLQQQQQQWKPPTEEVQLS